MTSGREEMECEVSGIAAADGSADEEPNSIQSKASKIAKACSFYDIRELIELATSKDGLVQDEIRKLAWPILLGCPRSSGELVGSNGWEELHDHPDEHQVALDVNRSFIYYPNGQSDQEMLQSKEQLSILITRMLRLHPSLSYFQGYHDIVQVLLLVLGPDWAFPALEHLSLLRIRDYMLPSLQPALAHLQLIPAILIQADPKLFQHLSHTQPFFALAATLTLYAHDIEEYGDIARLFDFLIAQEAVVSVYLFAAIILSRKAELLDIPPDEPEMLHSVLSKMPKPLDLEALISQTMNLFSTYPPASLPFGAWRRISRYSVLKTTRRDAISEQTIEQGELLFQKQIAELKRQEKAERARAVMRKYKKPAMSMAIAILVVIIAYWFRKHPSESAIGSVVTKLALFSRSLLGTAWSLLGKHR